MMPVFEPPMPFFEPLSTELPKPPVPYTAGWRFTADSHTVAGPAPVVNGCCINSENDWAERSKLRLIDRCLKYPLLPGKEGNNTVSLEVIDILKEGDGHNSQVFTVRLLFQTSSQRCESDGPTNSWN